MFEAYTFGAVGATILPLSDDAGQFPLPELRDPFFWQDVPPAFPIVRPSQGMTEAEVARVLTDDGFLNALSRVSAPGSGGGVCLDLSEYSGIAPATIGAAMLRLRNALAPRSQETCLIGALTAGFWSDASLRFLTDVSVGVSFDLASPPTAPLFVSESVARDIDRFQSLVPPANSVIAIGDFGRAWRSGQRTPEIIPFAVAMNRAAENAAVIAHDPGVGNTNIRYLDAERRANQIWLQDAFSFADIHRQLAPRQGFALWPVGYEDPLVWEHLKRGGDDVPLDALSLTVAQREEAVLVSGAGPFARLVPPQTDVPTGSVTADAQSDVARRYADLPRPVVLSRFGAGEAGTLVLSFNGLGDWTSANALYALLADYGIEASFFVSSSDMLLSRNRLAEIVGRGHSVGTTTALQTATSEFAALRAGISLRIAQNIVSSETGQRSLLVRLPFSDGELPTRTNELQQLQAILSDGYIPVAASVPFAQGRIDPALARERVTEAAIARDVNILSFDFSTGNASDVMASLPQILAVLRQDGFVFQSVGDVAQLAPEVLMPISRTIPPARDQVTYALLGLTWIGLKGYVLLLALIFMLRAPIYLALALLRREPKGIDPAFKPKVSVIVPAYNEEKVIARTLQSILRSKYENYEIIVIDDGSTDRTADIAESFVPGNRHLTVIRHANKGKWHAVDLGVLHSDAPIFLIVDADTLLDPDAICEIVQPFKDDAVGAVAGTVEVGNENGILTILQSIEYRINQIVLRRAYEMFHGILVVPGAIGAWRREAVIKAGFVSGDTITEDADMTVAVHRAGYRVKYQDRARSYTEAPDTVKDLLKQRFRWSFGMLQVAWKHKRSVLEGRVVGVISMTDAVLTQFIGSVLYVLIDVIFVVSLYQLVTSLFVDGQPVFSSISVIAMLSYAVLTLVDVFNLTAAFYFEKKVEWKLYLYLPFVRFGYRQLMYIASIKAIIRAVTGHTGQWNKLNRTNTAQMVKRTA